MTSLSGSTTDNTLIAPGESVRKAAGFLLRGNVGGFAYTILLSAVAAGTSLVGPWAIGKIINEVRTDADRGTINLYAGAVLLAATAQIVATRYAQYAGRRLGERLQSTIREQLLDRTLTIPTSVLERTDSGELTARATTDVGLVGNAFRTTAPTFVVSVLQAAFLLIVVMLVNPLLGACGLLGMAGIVIVTRWYLRRAKDAYLAEGAANSALAEQLTASVAGARTIETFGLQMRRRHICQDAITDSRRAQERTLRLRSVLFPTIDVSYAIPVVSVLLVGGMLNNAGQVSLGVVVASALYFRQLSQPLDAILQQVELLQSASASFSRLEGVAQVARPATGYPRAREPRTNRLELRGVSFAYEDSAVPVVDGLNLAIEAGERLAIVGPSGAGKTTLAKLIAAIDCPTSGEVTLDGVPVNDIAPNVLRQYILLVTQEQHLFLGTVRENLSLARPTASDGELMYALETVGMSLASLPEGLETQLRGAGFHPDPAQLQQLALTRVLLADPHIVVLDEATSLLNPAVARRTEQAMAAVLKGRTVIAIAHRLHTSHDADRVAVMEDGRLIELGSHDSLLASGGTYSALWHSWQGSNAP
jgi:ATP-binding cassette subfamily C protein